MTEEEEAPGPHDPVDGDPFLENVREAVLFGPVSKVVADDPVTILTLEGEEGPTSVQIIATTVVQGRVLVAVPVTVWQRSSGRRVLPQGALGRPTSFAVQASSTAARDVPVDGVNIRVWVGCLSETLEGQVSHPEEEDEPLQIHLPWSQALVAVADERFAFAAVLQESSNEARLTKLEAGIEGLQASMQALLSANRAPAPALALQAAAPKAVQKGRSGLLGGYSGLDPAVVQNARQAPEAPEGCSDIKRARRPASFKKRSSLPSP